MKRTLKPLSLSKTPLIFVLAQVRVSPIESISEYFPRFQDLIRKEGFPLLSKRNYEIREIQSSDRVTVSHREQWEFINAEKSASILLDSNNLIHQTTDYTSAEAFLAVLKMAAEIFQEVASPSMVDRIGLRYVDLVEQTEDVPIAELVDPALRGIDLSEFGTRVRRRDETLMQTGKQRQLRIVYTEAENGIALPPDLLGPYAIGFRKPIQHDRLFGLLDFDHFDENSFLFDPDQIDATAGELHDLLDITFRKLVTKKALELWK